MKMDKHVNKTCHIAYSYMRRVSRVRKNLDAQACSMALCSLVLSRIDFCVSLLRGIGKQGLVKLERVVKNCRKMSERQSKRDEKTLPRWLPVEKRVLLRQSMIVRTVLGTGYPSYLANLLVHATASRSLRSQRQQLLLVPRCRTSTGSRNWLLSAVNFWNSLPLNIRLGLGTCAFRAEVECLLLGR